MSLIKDCDDFDNVARMSRIVLLVFSVCSRTRPANRSRSSFVSLLNYSVGLGKESMVLWKGNGYLGTVNSSVQIIPRRL